MKNIIDTMIKSLPKYKTTLPSSQKTVSYRPFTVREEKMLHIVSETGNYEDLLLTISSIIDSCFDLKYESKTLPMFDIEYLFLKLRSKSISEVATPIIVCPETQEKIKITLNLEEIEPIYNKEHLNEIKVNSNIIVKMKYPSLEYFIDKRDNSKIDYYELVIDCIESIQTKDELILVKDASREEISNFVDLLKNEEFAKLINFFKTMPKLQKVIRYKTTDGIDREIILKGIKDFFQ
jgi:hypothetical protein